MKKLFVLVILVAAGYYLYTQTGVLDSVKSAAGVDPRWSGYTVIRGIPMDDEYGEQVDFNDVLELNADKVLVLHVCNANRPHCPRKTDKPHFEAIAVLQRNYRDDITVVGYNYGGSVRDVEGFKSYYGLDYEMLTCPKNLYAETREEGEKTMKDLNAFLDAIAGEDHRMMLPTTFFIKEGRYIVNTVAGMKDYSELENALNEVMQQDDEAAGEPSG